MIKQYTIGRGDDCQIRIQDNSQRVSRKHATLKVADRGKMFITDHSSNGTFVNGVKITPNVDFPVKRGDNISFAHAVDFDWKQVPRSSEKILFYILGLLLIVGIGVSVFLYINKPCPSIKDDGKIIQDSLELLQKERQKMIDDSLRIAKIVQDSLNNKKEEPLPVLQKKRKEKEKKKPAKDKTEKDSVKKEKKQKPIIY